MKKTDVRNLRAKEQIAAFVTDKLLHEPKPRKLEKVYSILAGVDDFEVGRADQTDPRLKEYLEQLSRRALNSDDFAIDVLDMLLFISKHRKDVVSEMIILTTLDILEQKVRGYQQEKKAQSEAPRRPLTSLPKDAVPPPMPQIGTHSQQEDIVVKEQAVLFKEDERAEDHFKYKHDQKRFDRMKEESELQRTQLAVMRINQRIESKANRFKPVFSSGDERNTPASDQAKPDSDNDARDPQEPPAGQEDPKPQTTDTSQPEAAADMNEVKSASDESDDEGEDDESAEGDEDASGESFDAEAFYEQFKHYEHVGLGDLNDSYLFDVRDPKDRSFQKEYVFERGLEEPKTQADTTNILSQSQTLNSKPRKPIMVLKKRLTAHDKKKLDGLMSRIQRAKDGRELAELQMKIEQIIYIEAGAQQDYQQSRAYTKQGYPKDKKSKKGKVAEKKKKREEKKKAKKLLKRNSQPPSATAKPNQPLPEFKKKDSPAQVKPIAKKPAPPKQKSIGTVFQNIKKWEGSDEEGSYPKFNQILNPTVLLPDVPPTHSATPADVSQSAEEVTAPEPTVASVEQPPAEPIKTVTSDALHSTQTQQLPPEPSPAPTKDRYLRIEDLSSNFEYKYIIGLDEDFRAAIAHLSEQKVIGFDTEFITADNQPMATYLQFASRDKGYIFNLQTEDRYKTEFKSLIEQVCKNSQLLKVGFNIKQDIPALTRVFNYELECDGFVSLEERLFTSNSVSLGLSDLCLRKYGYPMNKEQQKLLAKKKDLDDPEEIIYGVLDALAPLSLYLDLKKVIDSSPHDHLYLEDEFEPKDIEFMIDASCKGLKPLIQRSEFFNEVLDSLTYEEIKAKTHSKKSVLITCDKAIISDPLFKNKFVYYDMKSFKQGTFR